MSERTAKRALRRWVRVRGLADLVTLSGTGGEEAVVAVVLLIFKRADGKWGWKLKSKGYFIASDGGRGYDSESDCRSIADAVVGGAFAGAETKIVRG